MSILIALHVLFSILALIFSAIDWKKDFGCVRVVDLCVLALMSIIPLANVAIVLAVGADMLGIGFAKFFDKKVF